VAGTDAAELLEEHRILSDGCGLVDRSERGKLALVGADAVEFLNGQVTNDLGGLRPGEGRYAAFLTHKGKMLGDLRILASGSPGSPDQNGDVGMLLLDTERVALQALFDMIRHFKVGYGLELRKRTLESGLYSLIGPSARAVAARAADLGPAELPPEVEHAHARALIGERPVRLIATEHGELDVLFETPDGQAVGEALLDAGANPVSERAAEVVRVERSRPRYGIDMDSDTIPEEAGLNERAVSFTKGCYLGQETVARLHYRGRPNRYLRGLRLGAPAETGEQLLLTERSVGRLGSTALSPGLGPIGLALVRREAEPGARVRVGAHEIEAEVLELPFPSA
jgi:folate-binding protein YgfZ